MRCFIGKRKKPLFVCQNQRFLVNNKLYLIVKSSPFGRAGAQAPERASPTEWILHIAIRCLFQRDVVSQCKCYLVSILALSVTYGDTSSSLCRLRDISLRPEEVFQSERPWQGGSVYCTIENSYLRKQEYHGRIGLLF